MSIPNTKSDLRKLETIRKNMKKSLRKFRAQALRIQLPAYRKMEKATTKAEKRAWERVWMKGLDITD